ncbi:MAG: T9SS type A sorting domain-containing protein [Bacteroidales bacterium]|jgi:hypothetical protein|nr:T9SS type A sorting domain-containing protein [Bacteroidales bacterium]
MKKVFTILRKSAHRGLIFAGFMLFFVSMEAQKIKYNYDESGNRTKRYISKSLAIDTVGYKAENDSIADNPKDPYNWDERKKDAFEVIVYPNPTQGIIEVEISELKTNQKAQMQIYSITGSFVKHVRNLQKRQSVDLTDLSSGIYLLYITADENTVVKKIIKQ